MIKVRNWLWILQGKLRVDSLNMDKGWRRRKIRWKRCGDRSFLGKNQRKVICQLTVIYQILFLGFTKMGRKLIGKELSIHLNTLLLLKSIKIQLILWTNILIKENLSIIQNFLSRISRYKSKKQKASKTKNRNKKVSVTFFREMRHCWRKYHWTNLKKMRIKKRDKVGNGKSALSCLHWTHILWK